MASFNRVIIVGNLTAEIDLRYTQSGKAVTDVSLAINDRRKDINGEWNDEVTFVDVTLWGRTAEVASEYLGKGSQVLFEGRLKLDTWETDGQKRSKLKVVVEKMQMLGNTKKPRPANDDELQEAGAGTAPAHGEDDIPF